MKKNKVWLAIILAAALAGTIYFLFFYSRVLDTREYIRVEFSGVSGYGTCKAVIREDQLKKDIQMAIKGSAGSKPETLEESSFFDGGDMLSVTCRPDKKLKNGDKVRVDVTFDNTRWKPYGFRFRCSHFTVKVEKLSKGKKFNPFSGYALPVHGTAPFGFVKADELFHNGVTFTCTPGTGLKTGDTVVLEIDEKTLSEGQIASETVRTYKIGDMDTFVMQGEDMTEKNKETFFYDVKKHLKEPSLYDGLTPVIYHAEPIAKSGRDRQETLKDISIKDIVMEKEGTLYTQKEERSPQNICLWPYRIHFTKDGKEKTGYGAAVVQKIVRQKNGELTFQDGAGEIFLSPTTDIYFDRADLLQAVSIWAKKNFSGMEEKKISK